MRKRYQKQIEHRLLLPILQFTQREKSSGIVLAVFVVLALLLANSPLRSDYLHFLEHHFGFIVDGKSVLNFSVAHWINDGLMSMFFFVVGLELKREFIGGELRDLRKVTLPVAAAVFGMLVPALIYLLFNLGTPFSHGWGIPMATDIAFALALLYMLGDRIPVSAKVFLTTLAIVDDLGSVVVIALFYTSNISFSSLALGILFLGIMFAGNRLGIKNVWFYGLIGIGGVWLSFLTSGIHATISAVLAAMVIPADSRISEATFIARIHKLTIPCRQHLLYSVWSMHFIRLFRLLSCLFSPFRMQECRLSTWISVRLEPIMWRSVSWQVCCLASPLALLLPFG